ncbi:hypothetical protein [Parasedimentitalea maritima]|uniref:Uncharacterized protein n=1 Tax=Parasedimentitalea maritima TaxID=2578117 RepID=A0A6A4RKL4_9RHOB|nr:hypothetical protein [Zongyanglinia marina]KAE9632399.1 hypothetical protein GP644_01075 [Zongyanglinia marina]
MSEMRKTGQSQRAEQFAVVLKMLALSAPAVAITVSGSGLALQNERVPEVIGRHFFLVVSIGWLVVGLFLLSWGKRRLDEIDRKHRPWMYQTEAKGE